jgi:crossover junction endodeoxyribonuclease RusA
MSRKPIGETTLKLVLPLPPGVNNQYVTVGNRRVLSKPAQAFKKDVQRLIDRRRGDGSVSPAFEEHIKGRFFGAYMTFYFETPNRRDLDGGLKIALDAVCDAFGIDDRMVVDLHLTKQIDPLNPRLEMELEVIEEWSFDRSYVYLGESGGEPTAE